MKKIFYFFGLLSIFAFAPSSPLLWSCEESIAIQTTHTPKELVDLLLEDSSDHWILVRGVAPAEALASQNAGEYQIGKDGRILGRAGYGIEDEAIKPVWVVNQTESLGHLTVDQKRLIFGGLTLYSSQGAALERYAREFPEEVAHPDTIEHQHFVQLSIATFKKETGYTLVFQVPKTTSLEFHPESRAPAPERVVALPIGAKLIAVSKQLPSRSDKKTGYPIF